MLRIIWNKIYGFEKKIFIRKSYIPQCQKFR